MLAKLEHNPEFLRLAAQYEAEVANLKPFRTDAEIVPESKANWYVVIVQSGHDRITAGHLAGRRFGVYVPEFEEMVISRGRKMDRTRPLFPGYVLSFVWGINEQRARIRACPGVIDILSFADGTPAIVPDSVMDEIMKLENQHRPLKVSVVEQVTESSGKKGKKKRFRKTKRPIESDNGANDIVAVRAFSPFRDVTKLDESGRNGVLMRALGLAS